MADSFGAGFVRDAQGRLVISEGGLEGWVSGFIRDELGRLVVVGAEGKPVGVSLGKAGEAGKALEADEVGAPAGAASLDAFGVEPTVRILSEHVNATDPRFGTADSAGVAASDVAFNAATLWAKENQLGQGSGVFLGYGAFKLNNPVTYYADQNLIGAGVGATKLKAGKDLGLNKAMLEPESSLSNHRQEARNFTLEGKSGMGGAGFYGSTPGTEKGTYLCDGIMLKGGMTAENLYCGGGFRSAVHMLQDHGQLYNSKLTGCHYALYLGYADQIANQIVDNCILESCAKAAIGISGCSAFEAVVMTATHLHTVPWAFWCEATSRADLFPKFREEKDVGAKGFFLANARTEKLAGNVFDLVSFESIGNGWVGSEDLSPIRLNDKGSYASASTYAKGNIVKSVVSGVTYWRAIAAVPKETAPALASAFWRPYNRPYEKVNAYELDDMVTQGGNSYRALQGMATETSPTPGLEEGYGFWGKVGCAVREQEWNGTSAASPFYAPVQIATDPTNTTVQATEFKKNFFRGPHTQAIQINGAAPAVFVYSSPLGAVADNFIEVPSLAVGGVIPPAPQLDDKNLGGSWGVRDAFGRQARTVQIDTGETTITAGHILERNPNLYRRYQTTTKPEMGIALETVAEPASKQVWMQTRGVSVPEVKIPNAEGITLGAFLVGSATPGVGATSPGRYGLVKVTSGNNGEKCSGEIV